MTSCIPGISIVAAVVQKGSHRNGYLFGSQFDKFLSNKFQVLHCVFKVFEEFFGKIKLLGVVT